MNMMKAYAVARRNEADRARYGCLPPLDAFVLLFDKIRISLEAVSSQ